MDWLLYDNGLRHERVMRQNATFIITFAILLKVRDILQAKNYNAWWPQKGHDVFKNASCILY